MCSFLQAKHNKGGVRFKKFGLCSKTIDLNEKKTILFQSEIEGTKRGSVSRPTLNVKKRERGSWSCDCRPDGKQKKKKKKGSIGHSSPDGHGGGGKKSYRGRGRARSGKGQKQEAMAGETGPRKGLLR